MAYSSIWPIDTTQSGANIPARVDLEAMAIKGVLSHSLKLWHYWNLTIFFSVISGHSLGEFYISAEMQLVYLTGTDNSLEFAASADQMCTVRIKHTGARTWHDQSFWLLI